ncbi:MAG: type 2 isopentenyl-diphosphate Delta-isomerase [Alphaproteobacteria bacterium]|nr:type 2 isopentenyl-diphosphate Delta-isomerase [Alphaproteobacteria bacterium]
MSGDIGQRKDHHLDIVLDEEVAGLPPAVGLGRYTLEPDSLPEVDLDAVDLSTTFLGRRLSAPLIIGAMTGGTDRAGEINRTLAQAAARVGVGMALGSQRAMLVRPGTTASFAVRDAAPDLPLLLGNVGAVQLNYGVGLAELRRLVEGVGADGLNVHLNPLQEAIQPEGDTRFSGLSARLADLIPQVGVPCLIKEVGAGISARTAARLRDLPIAGVEVAGTGGTSWAAVESHRAPGDALRAGAGLRLAGFGVPTAESLRLVRALLPDRLVVSSGGIRTGMDVAVSLALGADAVALAKPLLEAAVQGVEATVEALEALIFDLKVIAFCCGADSLDALRRVRVVDLRSGFPQEPPPGV